MSNGGEKHRGVSEFTGFRLVEIMRIIFREAMRLDNDKNTK
jgi:hypothetical protein